MDIIKDLIKENIPVFTYDTTDSTNLRAREYIKGADCDRAVFIARSQSAGRGRQGKSFYSPHGTGLYMTYIFSPKSPIDDTVFVTTSASVAVLRAIKKVSGKDALIKWVNDIYLDGKKICGILAEAITDFNKGIVNHIIIGVGINISTTDFPDEIKNTAGSLGDVDISVLAAQITDNLCELANNISDTSYFDYYKSHSLVIGKDIIYYENGIAASARAVDIDSTGGLVIQTEYGKKVLRSGEITVRLK